MGSFLWDDDFDDMCYSQHHHGRPLSVALTEPFDPFEPQPGSFFDDIPFFESDFASLRPQVFRQHHHHHEQHRRSRSSGRRYKREYFTVNYPQYYSNTYCFSPPPPLPPRRPINRVASREVLIEKIKTVTIDEPVRPAPCYVAKCIRAPSPPVRQLKIRPRPSSCYDLRRETSMDIHQQKQENHWSKVVDERHEEHYQYNYNFQTKADRIVPIEREPPPPRPPSPPRLRLFDATTSTEDLYIPPPPPPPRPEPIRPVMRTIGTTTLDLPRRPLSMTETQIIDRVEKIEKIRRDSTSSTEGADDGMRIERYHRAIEKFQRKNFLDPMYIRNETAMRSLKYYTADERRREKARVIVRTTAGPREALVDTSGIFGFPGEFSEPTSPLENGNSGTISSRNPFQPIN